LSASDWNRLARIGCVKTVVDRDREIGRRPCRRCDSTLRQPPCLRSRRDGQARFRHGLVRAFTARSATGSLETIGAGRSGRRPDRDRATDDRSVWKHRNSGCQCGRLSTDPCGGLHRRQYMASLPPVQWPATTVTPARMSRHAVGDDGSALPVDSRASECRHGRWGGTPVGRYSRR
jgi:hypothetical protein